MLDTDRLLELAIATARQSPSRPRKVGAVLVLADGTTTLAACNDFPAGVRDVEARHAHPERLLWIEHAERNAIFAAARRGLSTLGATLIATFHPAFLLRSPQWTRSAWQDFQMIRRVLDEQA